MVKKVIIKYNTLCTGLRAVTACKKLYRGLEKYWDELNSDESIQDYIESTDIKIECEVDDDGTPTKIVGYNY